jgi:carbonic anhydrase
MSFPQQSPIHLREPIYADLGKRALRIHWTGPVHGAVSKDEHGVHVDIAPDQDHSIELDAEKFHLVGFHFHHPCEHWIDDEQRTMELHLIHKSLNSHSLAVLGVFLDVDAKAADNPRLLKFVTRVSEILTCPVASPTDNRISVDPNIFVPPHQNEYYRYEGSLTTPEFDETVSWVVMRHPLLLKPKDLTKLIGEFIKPARFPQPLYRRFVLATFRPGQNRR